MARAMQQLGAMTSLSALLLAARFGHGAAQIRDPTQIPFSSYSVFNLPLGSGAQWQYNSQLASAGVVINTAGGWNENIYASGASDPGVMVTVMGSSGGRKGTYTLHIPANAQPAGPPLSQGGDNAITIDDTTTHTWWSFAEFQWTSPTTAVAGQGSYEPDDGSGIAFDHSNWDQGVGTLRESDLRAGMIAHMLRAELPADMLKSYGSRSSDMAPYAWPQTQEDSDGPQRYTGTIYYGVTFGIPANVREPPDIASDAGADMLWRALQHHGAMVRDSAGGSRHVVFQADQNVDPADPLIQGMQRYGRKIMSHVEILTNQGPDSVNGGGSPIVALDAPLSSAGRIK